MKIFDCFTFNNELDILEFRLEKLYSDVHRFVLVESRQTHTGFAKPLHFHNSKERFAKWADKISYFECPTDKSLQNWGYENYQRDFIRTCLEHLNCANDDLVFISDVDEIIDIRYIVNKKANSPFRIEMPFYYYFTNLKASEIWNLNVCTKWFDIINCKIGDRSNYSLQFPLLLKNDEGKNGGHYSYLFGYSIKDYQQKINSFAHGEYNNFYFKNKLRLRNCIENRMDIYERSWISLELDDTNDLSKERNGIVENSIFVKRKYFKTERSQLAKFFIKRYLYLLKVCYRIFLKLKIV